MAKSSCPDGHASFTDSVQSLTAVDSNSSVESPEHLSNVSLIKKRKKRSKLNNVNHEEIITVNVDVDQNEIVNIPTVLNSVDNVLYDEDSLVVRLDPHILPFNDSTIRASDFKHCETSTISPFEWIEVNHKPGAQPQTYPTAETEEVSSRDVHQDNLRFPRSFFSFFKDKSSFPLTDASQYCVDKFTALQGYLSVNPPFDTEIFHNAGIQKCCERPPPSVNDCLRKKKESDDREFLNSLPKMDHNKKVNAWLTGQYNEATFADLFEHKIDSRTSIFSQYYQSDFLNSHFLEMNDIPHLEMDEFLKLLSFLFLQSWLSFLAGPLVLLLSTIIFFMFLGQKGPVFSFQLLLIFGNFLDTFFDILESMMARFLVFFLHNSFLLRFKRNRCLFMLKMRRFLARLSSFFLPGGSSLFFKPGILFLPKLRHIPAFLSTKSRLKSSFRRYQAQRLSRGKRPLLQLHHLNNVNSVNDNMPRIPMFIQNNVPLIKADIGKMGINVIIDSGSPCNIVPYSLLKEFESSSGFQCVRFENQMKLQAHNLSSLNIKDFGAIIPLTFIDCAGNGKTLHLPFLLEDCTGKDVIIGLPQIKCLNVDIVPSQSSCTLTLESSFSKIKPISPVPVYSSNDMLIVPDNIKIMNGLYHLSSYDHQSMHEPTCKNQHDPRVECCLENFTNIEKYLPSFFKSTVDSETIRNQISLNEQVLVKSNRCEKRPKASGTMLSELVGVLEFISDTPRDQSERKSRPGFRLISNSSVPRVPDLCDAPPADIDEPHNDPIMDLDFTNEPCNDPLMDLDFVQMETDSEIDPFENQFHPEVNIKHVSNLPSLSNVIKLHFVNEGPDFVCLFSDDLHVCNCTPLKHKDIVRFRSFNKRNDKSPKIMVAGRKNETKLIYFSLPYFVRICDTQKIALLIKLLHKFGTLNIIWDITGHGLHPSLFKFIEDLKLGFSRVLMPSQIHFNLYVLDKSHAEPTPLPPPVNKLQNICIEKNTGLRGADSIIPESILHEAEAFPFLPVQTLQEDMETFLSHSGSKERGFLQDLLKTYSTVPSTHPGDIGKVKDEKFHMDIVLKDPLHPLPLDMPFPSSVNKKLACSKIVQHWMDAGIVVPSSVRTHASRLTVAHKHLNKNDFNKIINRLKIDNNLDFSHLEISEFHRVSPSLLTAYEISKSYRVCLDARNLNNLTADEIVCSPNPDIMISELMFMNSDQSSIETNADLISNVPEELLEYLNSPLDESDDDKMYYSSLDIRSAHTSLVLTERASQYLNVILPDYQIVRFIQAPFGLKTINSRWNSFLTTILKDLIERRLVCVYADDILVYTRGRRLHRLVSIEIFRRLYQHGVKLSLNKCYMFVPEFKFLGFHFTSQGIKLTDERISGILNINPPSNLQGVQRLLGSLNYISRFLPDLQEILLPITSLLSKTNPFHWSDEHDEALNKVKQLVKDNSQLGFIDADVELSLYCDSSKKAGGAVLFQWDKNKHDQPVPVCFFSRKYNAEQTRHLSSLELELLNLIDSLARLKAFVNITSKPIKLYTDAKSVLFLLKSLKVGPNPKLARLGSRLAQFDIAFHISYVKPMSDKKFLIADFLSRSRDAEESDNPPPPPMKAFRKIEKEHIKHNILPGTVLTLTEMISKVEENPDWFPPYFPTPLNPYPPELYDNLCSPVDNVVEDSVTPLSLSLQALDTTESHPRKMHNIMFLRRDLSPAELMDQQLKDEFIRPIVDILNQNPDLERTEKGYFLRNQILHKVIDDTKECIPTNSLLVLPKKMVPNIVAEFHVAYGHLGRDKLLSLLNSLYHSPTLNKTCISITQGCHICQLVKPGNSRLPPLVPSKTASFPLNIFAIDFCKVPSYKGFTHILIGIDHFSGFIITRACRSESATEVTSFLSNVFANFGSPITIKSDNGTSLLKAKPVRNLLALWGVEVASLSLAYTPVHNGKVERSIRAFRALVRSLSPDNVRGWYPNLNRLTFIHNSTPRIFKMKDKTVLASPFELFLRRKPTPLFVNTSLVNDPSAADYFQENKDEIEKMQKFVAEFLAMKNKEYIEKMNINSHPSSLKVGDLCILRDNAAPRAGDLPKKYFPPYLPIIYLVRHVKDLLCVLEDPLTGNVIYQNVRFVKKYKSRDAIFLELNKELQEVIGYPFNPLNFSSRKQLLDFLAANRLTDDLQPEDQEQNSMDQNSQVSILPLISDVNNVPGSVDDPPVSLSDSTPNLVRSIPSLPPASVFQTQLLDEFYPATETEFDYIPDHVAPRAAPKMHIDSISPDTPENLVSTETNMQPSGSLNPWRRLTRAAKAKLKY